MARRVLPPFLAVVVACLAASGCSTVERPQRPAWREQAEKACIAEHRVQLSRYVQPRGREIDGPGICGLTEPFMVGAVAGDSVQLDKVATLDCSMIAALDEWVTKVVQPVAQARFGQSVAQIDTMGSYSCRGMNGQAGAKISEHAFGNALDVGGFRLADGRRITVVGDWTRGDEQSQAFLRDVHAGACETFTTVLGPGSNAFHYNHIHVDLAMHAGGRRYCKPTPEASRPGPAPGGPSEIPQAEEEQDVASSAVPSDGDARRGVDVGAPPAYAGQGKPARAAAYSPVPGSRYRAPEGAPGDWDVTSSIPRR